MVLSIFIGSPSTLNQCLSFIIRHGLYSNLQNVASTNRIAGHEFSNRLFHVLFKKSDHSTGTQFRMFQRFYNDEVLQSLIYTNNNRYVACQNQLMLKL